ncbi:MAG: hypothetical protein AAFX81_15465 [Pseudomonadota bacterium]
MKPRSMLPNSMAALLVATLVTTPAGAFSLSGRYEGFVACDSTTAGDAQSWGRTIEVLIFQSESELSVEYRYTDEAELGPEYTLYGGETTTSADGAVVSAYFNACDASFPALELVRMFPSSTTSDPFSFTADSIWVSDEVPNLPGLTVQSCRWSMRRVSSEAPTVRTCPAH